MDGNTAFVIVCAIVAIYFGLVNLFDAIENIKVEKYRTYSDTRKEKVDHAVYDLNTYTNWLYEKGVLREGFRIDKLVEEYVLTD